MPIATIDRAWAFGAGDGAGVTVAVIDSGVEGSHPAIGGALVESVRIELDGEDTAVVADEPTDAVGHGTACAGIIHALAPRADHPHVRVLGSDNRGKGLAFAAGLEWAIARGAAVVNLSLSSRSEALYATFHDLADRAYFANCLLVCAANNVAVASYPSLFAAWSPSRPTTSVTPNVVLQPSPPVEFGAYGLDVDVAWRDGGRIVATGNSFAAPHIAGLAARIRRPTRRDAVRGQDDPRSDGHIALTRTLVTARDCGRQPKPNAPSKGWTGRLGRGAPPWMGSTFGSARQAILGGLSSPPPDGRRKSPPVPGRRWRCPSTSSPSARRRRTAGGSRRPCRAAAGSGLRRRA